MVNYIMKTLIDLLRPHADVSVAFQQFLLQATNGQGNFLEFANGLSWQMQLGMLITFLDVKYDITIAIFPKGGAVIKVINDRQYVVNVVTTENPIHPMERYQLTIEAAFEVIEKPY